MPIQIKTYTFEEAYLPTHEFLTIDDEKEILSRKPEEEIAYPVTDGNILDAVIRVLLTHHKAKTPLAVAHVLNVDRRDLSGAIRLLTGMSHEDFLHQYRLRAMVELLTSTKLATTTIAKYFGYATLRSFNQFLVDQTELTANEIRAGVDASAKVKRLAWWER